MPEPPVLRDLLVVLATALVVVLVFARLKLPAIAGFLVAGALVGPAGLGWVGDQAAIERLAEVGVALLLFTIGLEFSLARLRRIARAALAGGGLQVGLSVAATWALARALGHPTPQGLFLGFLVALSSTAIVLRALSERGEVASPHGRIVVGVLLFQDLCVVPMMLVVPMLAGGGAGAPGLLRALALAGIVVVGVVLLARFVVPPAFERVARTRSRELFLIAVVLVGAGIAWATSRAGLSLALGAFLAGLVLADGEFGHEALSHVLPLRDLFTSFFFVSMGMLLDVGLLAREPGPVLAIALALLAGKGTIAALACLLLRLPLRVAVVSGFALAQVGEFSFVLAELGEEQGLIGARTLALFLDASVLTMLVTPFALRLGPAFAERVRWLRRLERAFGAGEPPGERTHRAGHVLVLGYGVGGELVCEALAAADRACLVVDLDLDRVRAARSRGLEARYGDAAGAEALVLAGARRASQALVLLNDPEAAARAVRTLRRLAPRLPISVRARELADAPALVAAGADAVVAQELAGSREIARLALERAAQVAQADQDERPASAR